MQRTVTPLRPTSSRLEHKEFQPLLTKAVTDEPGVVEVLVAVTGNTDDGGDVIESGAVDYKRQPVVVWSHDVKSGPIAKVLEKEEWLPGDTRLPQDLLTGGFGAVWWKVQFDLEDPDSFRAYRKVVFHETLGWSIGYEVDPNGGFKMLPDGRRSLKHIYVWEGSPTTFGMNEEARTMAVKDRLQGVLTTALAELPISDERKTSLVDLVALLATPEGEEGERQEKAWPPLAGSFEDLSRRIREVIQTWAVDQYGERTNENQWYCYIEGTFDDSVVATVDFWGGDRENVTLRFPYTEGTDGTIELGDPEEVEVQSVVTPPGTSVADTGTEPTAEAKAKAHKPHAYATADGEDSCSVCGQEEDSSLHAAEKAMSNLLAVQAEIAAEQKAGRVLSATNRDKLQAAVDALQTVLDAAEPTDDDDGKSGGKKPMKKGEKVLSRSVVGKGEGGTIPAEVPEGFVSLGAKDLMEMMAAAGT